MAENKTYERTVKINAPHTIGAKMIADAFESLQQVFTYDELKEIIPKIANINGAEKVVLMQKLRGL